MFALVWFLPVLISGFPWPSDYSIHPISPIPREFDENSVGQPTAMALRQSPESSVSWFFL